MTSYPRRKFLLETGTLGLAAAFGAPAEGAQPRSTLVKAQPFPLSHVRLTPSPWLDAVETNRRFLLSLEPDRLLARFRENAGLAAKAPVYGGWESDTIAGHTLGHYLSALSLMHAQTGDVEVRRRAEYIVAELALCQAQSGDGYVAALGRRVDGQVLANGKTLFDDVMRGEIDPRFGNLNGGWAPLYNIHKQLAGLLDAHLHLESAQALAVAEGMAGYLHRVFAVLNKEQMQQVLDCEYGGLQESIAELYARTGDQRWLRFAQRLRHEKTFRPVAEGRDELDKAHSNTEIPKYVGAARLYELDGDGDNAAAVNFFWRTVTGHRSYVIGGNGDREWFYPKGQISRYITDQTCEHCSTYNMLKITRHLFQWEPHGKWFDFFERAHLNHTLAAQHPGTGMFAYMMPTMAGARRTWSEPRDQFWCCMGSGMEAHAKHGDSIYWHGRGEDREELYVNEYVPSVLEWPGVGRFQLQSGLPHRGTVTFTLSKITSAKPIVLKFRLPAWAKAPRMTVNGRATPIKARDGYAQVARHWRAGDRVELVLPMALQHEATPDDPTVQAFMYGPMVLAADLGNAGDPLPPEAWPAVFADAGGKPIPAAADGIPRFRLTTTTGERLTLRPFYRQYDTRTAIYFKVFGRNEWRMEAARRDRLRAERESLAAGAVDLFLPGDPSSESMHDFVGERTELTPYRGRKGRLIKAGGGYIEASLTCKPAPLVLHVSYWGEAERGQLDISIDGRLIATQLLNRERPGDFYEAAYQVPQELLSGKGKLRLRLEPRPGTRGPSVYGVRLA